MLKTSITALTEVPKALSSTLDPYTDEALPDPWPTYRELREMGAAVWLEKYRVFKIPHFKKEHHNG